MSVLLNKKTRVIVQGITGKEGSFHAEQMIEYGTNVVGGVTPGKGGQKFGKIPVFDTVAEAVKKVKADASTIFVPPPLAADAIFEAVEAGIELIVCITEGIPVLDMMKVKQYLKNYPDVVLIGPNCPGLLTPGEGKMGIIPGFIAKKGIVGIISRSGTLTYEAMDQLTKAKLGQTTCIGIGGDPIIGTQFIDAVKIFEKDSKTKGLVIIGEIGGDNEIIAAEYIKKKYKRPVVGFIAGQTAPEGKRMGHAGAIISGGKGDAASKIKFMTKCGIKMVSSPSEIGEAMKKLLKK
jgi:succinyl-CoA synthetase alpha subunit